MSNEPSNDQPQADSGRNNSTDQLLTGLTRHLRSLAFQVYPGLLVADYDTIMGRLQTRLLRFESSPEESLHEMARQYVVNYTTYFSRFYALHHDHAGIVFASIWGVLENASDLKDEATIVLSDRAIADRVWRDWARLHVNDLTFGRIAKPCTRLGKKSYWLARQWMTDRLRERDKAADVDVSRIAFADDGGLFIAPDFDEDSDQPVRFVLPPRKLRKKGREPDEDPSLPLVVLNTSLFCLQCQSLLRVVSESEEQGVLLACGHLRGRDIKESVLQAA